MAALSDKLQIDVTDGIQLRVYYESLRSWLAGERSSWDPHWQKLTDYFRPRMARLNDQQSNRGERRDYDIINETGGLAVRTLQSGMLTGMSSQTRPWFKFCTDIPEYDEIGPVRGWLEEVEEKCREVFLKSNVYQSLLTLYGEEGLYGTSAFLVEEDPKTTIRCKPIPLGEYYLMQDDTLRIDGCVRVLWMTVRQMIERFGYENCSQAMQTLYDSSAGGTKEQKYQVVNVIHKGSYFGESAKQQPFPWVSVWYELSSYNHQQGLLRRSGYLECPLICGRWHVTGTNVYGESPAMECLGSVMSLQAWEERIAQAAEKSFNPTMLASSDIDPRRLTTLPGGIIFANTKDVTSAFKPAYQFDFKLEGGLNQIQRIEGRINDAMYRSLFQMFSESDRRDITAEEIRARQQEKMQVLGPVVERNVEEVLAPLVMRTVSIMERRGMLPPMPQDLKGKKIKVEFISILAQAQKIGSISNLTQFMAFLGNEVAVDQGILDNVDLDAVAREYAELADVPNEVMRTADQVAQIRQDRAKQQQQQQQAENAQKLAAAAQNMSNTQLGTGSLLDKALPALAGGQE